ncbi:MAG: glycosyltransferase family 2 protein [Acidimicrobiales bacterium]
MSGPIRVPAVDRPLVSILVLTYGAGDWVARALAALVASTAPVYELVVLDNASPDGTGSWLADNLEGATLLRNDTNVGFGPGQNQAALAARGRYLCLLNSDALVEAGWLEPLVADLEQVRDCGAVVPRLLNLDGTLQEAGAVVGAEGWTMAMGYGDDPARPWYRFPRYVSYGSGACLCLRRSTFLELGGFDARYGLGYYEDVDLCFRLREQGMRIVYEPRSVVRHVRGASSPAAGVVRLRERNAQRFRDRWPHALSFLPSLADLPAHPYRVVAARDVEAPDRVLVMGARLPRSAEDRVARLALGMMAACGETRVTVVGLADAEPAEEMASLMDAGVELVWGIDDWDDWMERCRCHYSVAVVTPGGAGTAGRALELLAAYQPQAAVVVDVEGPGELRSFPPEVLARAEAIWCEDQWQEGDLERALAGVGVVTTGAAGWGGRVAGWSHRRPASSASLGP